MLQDPPPPDMQTLLDTWFGAPASRDYARFHKRWFKKSKTFDALLTERFSPLIKTALEGHLDDWNKTPLGMLALIVLLDQLPRNCFRGTPQAFAGDHMALALARRLVTTNADRTLPTPFHRVFAYMPFEHDETIDSQREAVRLFTGLYEEQRGNAYIEDNLNYAVRHAEVIERFGRFPHRNAVLGRKTTPEEEHWLKTKGGF
jgi:uncharacterized protein (DUF924 family)